jgi:hypothetical protein
VASGFPRLRAISLMVRSPSIKSNICFCCASTGR